MSGLPTTRDITREPSAFHTTQKNVKEMFSGKPSLVDLWKENGLDDSPLENLTSVEDLNLNLDVNLNTEEVNNVDDNDNGNNEESGVTKDDENSNVNDENTTTTGAEVEINTSSLNSSINKTDQENTEDTDDETIPNWMIFGGVTASIGILTALALRKK